MTAVDEAARDSDLVVLPEGSFPAYVLGPDPVDMQQVDAAVDRLRTIARTHSCVIVAGVAAKTPDGVTNAALAIDADGSIAGRSDKIFLWHFDRQWFQAGTRLQPVRTSAGNLGMLVCADGRMPGIARALVDRGAELLVMPTAWVTSGRDASSLENIQADLLARVRAFENGVPFVVANKCGTELQMVAYCGKSQIIAADGTVLACAPEREATALRRELTLQAPQPHRTNMAVAPCAGAARSVRVSISLDPIAGDARSRMAILESDVWLAPQQALPDDARTTLAALEVTGADLFDPGLGTAARAAGYRSLIWNARGAGKHSVTIARARALELRMYVLVFDRDAGRAFAVDPDGGVCAGTFEGYAIASFAFDARKTEATLLAPGTDVAEGIARIAGLVAS